MIYRLRLLLIDDELSFCDALSNALKDEGYDVKYETDPHQALETIRTYNPMIILLDLKMPGTSGFDILNDIRERKWSIPVILLTGAPNIEDIFKGIHNGAWDYIRKPVRDIEEINYKIQLTIEKFELMRQKISYQKSLESALKERDFKEKQNLQTIDLLRQRLEQEIQLHIQTEVQLNNLTKQLTVQSGLNQIERSGLYSLPISIFIINGAREIVEMNAYAQNKFNWIITGQSRISDDLIHRNDFERFEQWFERILTENSAEVSMFRVLFERKDKIGCVVCKATIINTPQDAGLVRLIVFELPSALKTSIYPDEVFFEHYELTERETDIAKLVIEGKKNKEIEKKLFISHNTLKTHLSNIFRKLSINERDGIFPLIIDYQKKKSQLGLLSHINHKIHIRNNRPLSRLIHLTG